MSSAVTRSFNSISFGSLSITQYQCLPMASRLRSACVYEKGFSDCGRDVHYWTPTGSPEAVARLRFPQNVACGFPAPRSSAVDSQLHRESLQRPVRELQFWSL